MGRVLAVAVLLLAPACAENVANRCPDTPQPRCLAGTVCENDPTRGCQVCRCASPELVPIQQPPQGAPTTNPP